MRFDGQKMGKLQLAIYPIALQLLVRHHLSQKNTPVTMVYP